MVRVRVRVRVTLRFIIDHSHHTFRDLFARRSVSVNVKVISVSVSQS